MLFSIQKFVEDSPNIIENLPNEIWKDIIGYEELYQISNLGRVKSLNRVIIKQSGKRHSVKTKLLSISINSVGYYCANLWKDNKGYSQPIHILLGRHFIDNPNNYPYVLHRDDIKTNIKLDNLYWGTNSDNVKDSINNGNRGIAENHCSAKLTNEQVKEIRILLNDDKISQVEIALKFNVSKTIIQDIKQNKTYKDV